MLNPIDTRTINAIVIARQDSIRSLASDQKLILTVERQVDDTHLQNRLAKAIGTMLIRAGARLSGAQVRFDVVASDAC
jgi:hypothetical protein